VGGYAKSRPGAFIVSRISASGRLVRSFGSGGVTTVPAIYWFKQAPPRMLAVPGGGVVIVGISRGDQFVAVKLNAVGKPVRGFGEDGVVQHKLVDSHGFSIVTAAVIEPSGDILATYQKELPQPSASSPRVPEGQGNGAIEYVQLLPSGAVDQSFGTHGFLASSGEKVGFIEGESGTVGACAETLSPTGSLLVAHENLALEELSPGGAVVGSFGDVNPPTARAPTVPAFEAKNDYYFCKGLFALPGGSVEGISSPEGGTGDEVTRLTPAGTPEAAFGKDGVTKIDVPTEAAEVSADGETFSAGLSHGQLTLTGVLPDGQLDPALGSANGTRFTVKAPTGGGFVPGNAEPPTWEVLPVGHTLTIRIGEEIVRISN
jgi:hypothetical protein